MQGARHFLGGHGEDVALRGGAHAPSELHSAEVHVLPEVEPLEGERSAPDAPDAARRTARGTQQRLWQRYS